MKLNAPIKILIPSVISQEDIKVLTLFYQPLLGMGAYAMYLTLYELSNLDTGVSETYLQKELLDILNIKTKDHLKYRHRLEALGLLVVYENINEYVYSLKTPLTAKEFLNDTILGSYLQDQIGEDQIKKLIKLFRLGQVDLTSYENITKSFNEVYAIKEVELLQTGNHLRGHSRNGGTKINYDKFNYDLFIEKIPTRYKRNHLFNPVVKENICKIAFIYQFDNDDIYQVYTRSSTRGEFPSEEVLRLQASLYYQEKNEQPTPEIVEKSDDLAVKLDKISPQNIIKMYSKRDNISVDLDTALAFSQRTDAPLGVYNAIILYTINEKEGILPNVKYLEKVLNTWQNNGVRTTQDAISYMNQLDSESATTKTRGRKHDKSIEPDWLEDYIKNF